jgi:FKBP-type peptidyl-prolyl cis-trans isomerase (trigger factor)
LLIEREIDHLLEEMQREGSTPAQRQTGVDDYVANLGKSTEEVRMELRPRAVERLQRAAVITAIAREEAVEVPPEAMEQEVAAMAQAAGQRGAEMRRLLSRPQNRESISRSLQVRFTLRRLAEIARGDGEAARGSEAQDKAD